MGNGKRRADDRRGMRQRLVVGYRSLPFVRLSARVVSLHLTVPFHSHSLRSAEGR